MVQHWAFSLLYQINEEEVRRGVILRRPKGKAPRPPRPKSEVFLDQAAKRRSKRYSAFGVSQRDSRNLWPPFYGHQSQSRVDEAVSR